MAKEESKRLLEAFPSHSYEEWKEAAVALLKGRPFEKTLITGTYEGFDLDPIYLRETMPELPQLGDLPGMGSQVRASRLEGYLEAGWAVSQETVAPTPGLLRERIFEGLERGQDEINLWLDRVGRGGLDPDAANASGVGVCGLSILGAGDWEKIFEGVHTEMVSLYVHAGAAAPAVYAELLAALEAAGKPVAELSGCIGFDPVGWAVETGQFPGSPEAVFDGMAALVRHATTAAPRLGAIEARGHDYHNGGASSVQELGAVLATAALYLREMTERGLAAAEVAPRIRLSLSVGGDFFLEIAKFRAARLLWNRILDAYEVPEPDRRIHLHARTGLWNKTVFDPYVNMLRTTSEAFAAVVGGCDSLHVGPFDEAFRESDAFARRIARNTHPILAEECGMSRVIDPGGGSYAVETLTDRMAEQAWKQLQALEGAGGILEALRGGWFQAEVEATRQAKVKNLQRRKDILIGTNQYPNPREQLLGAQPFDYGKAREARLAAAKQLHAERDEGQLKAAREKLASAEGAQRISALVEAAAAGATHSELFTMLDMGTAVEVGQPIRLKRGAEDFEALRMAARALEEAGKPPLVHQLNIGPSRNYRMRADWTTSFFEVAGCRVLSEEDYEGADAAAAAFAEKGASVAVITSDDGTYGEVVEDLAARLKRDGDGITVLVAGAPGEQEPAWKEAGVDDFVHLRVNNYTFNRELLESMGASL